MQLESNHATRPVTRKRDALDCVGVDPPRRLHLLTPAGHAIEALVYEPEGAVFGNVLIHSATACPQRFYAGFARHLAQAGLRVFTYDYRGIGRSRGRSVRREHVTMSGWALNDARTMHAHLEHHYPDVPFAIIGHSFGAQLIGLLDETHRARAALFVGAQLGYYGHWPASQAFGLRTFWKYLVPLLCGALGYLPKQAGLGEDLPRGVALQWARWCSARGYLMSEFPEAGERFARFDPPILSYSFSDDPYAPPRAVAALTSLLASARVWERRLTPTELGVASVGHFGFFRRGIGGQLWDQALDYLLAAVGANQQAAASA